MPWRGGALVIKKTSTKPKKGTNRHPITYQACARWYGWRLWTSRYDVWHPRDSDTTEFHSRRLRLSFLGRIYSLWKQFRCTRWPRPKPKANWNRSNFRWARGGADQVDIKVQHCGICHSDLSMLNNDCAGN